MLLGRESMPIHMIATHVRLQEVDARQVNGQKHILVRSHGSDPAIIQTRVGDAGSLVLATISDDAAPENEVAASTSTTITADAAAAQAVMAMTAVTGMEVGQVVRVVQHEAGVIDHEEYKTIRSIASLNVTFTEDLENTFSQVGPKITLVFLPSYLDIPVEDFGYCERLAVFGKNNGTGTIDARVSVKIVGPATKLMDTPRDNLY